MNNKLKELFIPRNLEGRHEYYLRNILEKLSKNNNIWEGDLYFTNFKNIEFPEWFKFSENIFINGDIFFDRNDKYLLEKVDKLELFNDIKSSGRIRLI